MIKRKSYGKVNLSLEVIGKRPDGYHNIDTLMQRIDLYDEIYFEPTSKNELILESNIKDLPVNQDNLVYKAWEIMSQYKKNDIGLKIYIEKNIPVAAGLAGGTTNAITTIKFLNKLWNLNFPKEKLIEISKPIGADSTFFYYNNLVRAQAIGDEIEEIDSLDNSFLLLINIGKGLSSKEIYNNIETYSNNRVKRIFEALKSGNKHYLYDNNINSMEEVSMKIYPELKDIKDTLLEKGAQMALMSGSGPTVFGLFESETSRDKAYNDLVNQYSLVLKSKLI